MNDITEKTLPPVRIHFSDTFPLETRCLTEEGEIAIMEILKVEYGLEDEPDENGNWPVTLFFTGIKSFSVSDDDQACLIRWELKPLEQNAQGRDGAAAFPVTSAANTGKLEMGERFDDIESIAYDLPEGDYTLNILRD